MTITKTIFHENVIGVCSNEDCGEVWQLGHDERGRIFAKGPFKKRRIG